MAMFETQLHSFQNCHPDTWTTLCTLCSKAHGRCSLELFSSSNEAHDVPRFGAERYAPTPPPSIRHPDAVYGASDQASPIDVLRSAASWWLWVPIILIFAAWPASCTAPSCHGRCLLRNCSAARGSAAETKGEHSDPAAGEGDVLVWGFVSVLVESLVTKRGSQ